MRLARRGAPGHERPLVSGPDGVRRDLSPITPDVTAGFLFDLPQDAVLIPRGSIRTGREVEREFQGWQCTRGRGA